MRTGVDQVKQRKPQPHYSYGVGRSDKSDIGLDFVMIVNFSTSLDSRVSGGVSTKDRSTNLDAVEKNKKLTIGSKLLYLQGRSDTNRVGVRGAARVGQYIRERPNGRAKLLQALNDTPVLERGQYTIGSDLGIDGIPVVLDGT